MIAYELEEKTHEIIHFRVIALFHCMERSYLSLTS